MGCEKGKGIVGLRRENGSKCGGEKGSGWERESEWDVREGE